MCSTPIRWYTKGRKDSPDGWYHRCELAPARREPGTLVRPGAALEGHPHAGGQVRCLQSQGLGLAISTALCADGASVLMVAREEEKLAEAAAGLRRRPPYFLKPVGGY